MSKFLTNLNLCLIADKKYRLIDPLLYESDILHCTVTCPAGMETDFSTVPRIPIIYDTLAERMQLEAVIHDYLYRVDSIPNVSRMDANKVFLEAMEANGRPWFTRHLFYWGVCIGGGFFYHVSKVMDPLGMQLRARSLKMMKKI